jgi:hypothetical protein
MINMIDPNTVRTNLEALAGTLEGSDPDAATRLRNLRSAIGGGNNADAWAASDIHRLIEPELIVERYKNQRLSDGLIAALEWLRNTLIFAPLVVTWYGISQAVEQYNVLIKADPGQITQPFLYLWQNGFGNRLQGWQTLGSLATIDFSLLGMVLVLTILVYTLSNGVKLRREQAAENLRATLAHTIACATLCLTIRHTPPTNFIQSAQQLKQTLDQLLARLEALATMQQQDHQTFNDFRRDLATIMGGVSTAVTDLKASNDALRRSMKDLADPATLATNHLGALQNSAQQAVDLSKDQIVALQNVVKSQQQWGVSLGGLLNRLDTTVQTAIDMSRNINDFTQKEKDLVSEMTQERMAQEEISNRMIIITDSLGKLVPQIFACATELNGVNVYLAKLIRQLALVVH